MRPPDFWFTEPSRPGWRAKFLSPVSWFFAAATAKRIARPASMIADIPVICIGNLSIGGAGKTPTAIAICQRLLERGSNPHFVSRGYGGSLTGPVKVDEKIHNSDQVGDEPLLLSAFTPTWVARDRSAAVTAAQNAGADIIIMDDGFQNPTVAKDLSIVVADAGIGFGNGRVFPSGPLREPVATGLARADLLLTIGTTKAQAKFARLWNQQVPIPHSRGTLVPLKTGMEWDGLRVLAFAGIGHPQKFFDTLTELGADIVQSQSLDDHQPYGPTMIKRLIQQAQSLNAQLVTTEKDAVRLPPDFMSQVLSLVVRLEIDDWGPIDALLDSLDLQKAT